MIVSCQKKSDRSTKGLGGRKQVEWPEQVSAGPAASKQVPGGGGGRGGEKDCPGSCVAWLAGSVRVERLTIWLHAAGIGPPGTLAERARLGKWWLLPFQRIAGRPGKGSRNKKNPAIIVSWSCSKTESDSGEWKGALAPAQDCMYFPGGMLRLRLRAGDGDGKGQPSAPCA